ncbi:MAG: tetratricopeptide repeat protein [Deltaproteobacteria bacterium]|nr:tetratricopeptide repeat protein [Deltaproteobacteria bacterium]
MLIEWLMALAQRAVELDRHWLATNLGRALQLVGKPYGYEVEAMTHVRTGRPEKALAVLRRGANRAPWDWSILELLGNIASDLARPDEARAAYARSLGCEDVEVRSVKYNLAACLQREGRFEEALREVTVSLGATGELRLHAYCLHGTLLSSLGRHDEALSSSEAIVGAAKDDGPESEATALAIRARALSCSGKREASESQIRAALELATPTMVLRILREIRDERSESARRFRLRLTGSWPDLIEGFGGPVDFLRELSVAADSPQRALQLASELEPFAARPTLSIDSCDDDGPSPGLTGVISATGHFFHPRET